MVLIRYVVATVYDDSVAVEAVTQSPTDFAALNEPIDVVNGKMIAWDENGNLYHFGPSMNLWSRQITRHIGVTEVGQWQAGEPSLLKVGEGRNDEMKAALVAYLKAVTHNLSASYERMEIDQLIGHAARFAGDS